MNDLIRSMIELFGALRMNPEVQEVLEYDRTPGYTIAFFIMLGIVILAYTLQYHIIDRPAFSRKRHLLISMGSMAGAVFVITWLYGTYKHPLGFFEVLPIAMATTIWSVVFLFVLTQSPIPRRYSTNCRYTKLI